jgi:hypothetical protein
MQRDDADVALGAIWLNDVVYEHPVDDPLFSAHSNWTYNPGGGYPSRPLYRSDNAAEVIGCAEQVTATLFPITRTSTNCKVVSILYSAA